MIEVLDATDAGTCLNCGGGITEYWGDLLGKRWSHDATGRRECPGSTYAEPAPVPAGPGSEGKAER